MPPTLASVVHTFVAVAGSWGSVSAPTVSRVMGGASERNKNSNRCSSAQMSTPSPAIATFFYLQSLWHAIPFS